MKVVTRFLFLIIFIAFIACEKKSNKVQVLDVSSFESKLKTTSEKILLDVRTIPEYQQGHLANSIMIDVKQNDFETKVNALDKSTPVFVYCASGIRSERAGKILSEKGFSQIYHLDGGLNQWEKENKQIVRN